MRRTHRPANGARGKPLRWNESFQRPLLGIQAASAAPSAPLPSRTPTMFTKAPRMRRPRSTPTPARLPARTRAFLVLVATARSTPH